jgi:hypothetical protein
MVTVLLLILTHIHKFKTGWQGFEDFCISRGARLYKVWKPLDALRIIKLIFSSKLRTFPTVKKMPVFSNNPN